MGGGGAILALPVLVYVLGEGVGPASTASLIVVAVAAAVGAGVLARDGQVCRRLAVLTGFFGVGGGFIVVPVLSIWLGAGFRRAVATSLVIVTLTGVAALVSHLVAGAAPDVGLTAALAGATVVGAVAGAVVNRRLPQRALGRAFAVLVVVVAAFLLVDTLILGGPPAA